MCAIPNCIDTYKPSWSLDILHFMGIFYIFIESCDEWLQAGKKLPLKLQNNNIGNYCFIIKSLDLSLFMSFFKVCAIKI